MLYQASEFFLFIACLYAAEEDLKDSCVSLPTLSAIAACSLFSAILGKRLPPLRESLFFLLLCFLFWGMIFTGEKLSRRELLGGADLLLPLLLFPHLGLLRALFLLPLALVLALPAALILLVGSTQNSPGSALPLFPYLLLAFLVLRCPML